MKKLLLISILALLSQWAFAQIEVIEIDTLTNTPNKPLPFDKPFVLKMYVADDVISLTYLKQYGRRTLAETIVDRIKDDAVNKANQFENANGRRPTPLEIQGIFNDFYRIPDENIINKKIGEKKVAFISFTYPFLLKPNTTYFFIINHGSLDNDINTFFKKFYLYTKNNIASDFIDAQTAFADFKKSHVKIFGDISFLVPSDNHFNTPANVANFQVAIRNRGTYTKSLFELFDDYYTNLTAANGLLTGADLALNWNTLKTALGNLRDDVVLTDTKQNNKTFEFLARDTYKVINAMVDANYFDITELRKGQIALNCLSCDKINASIDVKTNKRISNLATTIALLNDIRRSVGILSPSTPSDKANALTELTKIVNDMLALNSSYNTLLKSENAVKEAILTRNFGGFRFYGSTVLNGGSHILNLETRSKNLITPDFGMAFPNIVRQNTNYGLLPYVGFHINFAPIDRDAIFSKYKKSVAQRFSLSIGYSLVSIKDSTAKGQKFNFFEKSSFLTGIGFRLGNLVRVLGGYQWYFEAPASTVALEKKLKGYPFLGLSIDLSVKSLLNGLGDILPGISKTRETIKPVNIAQP